MDEKACKDLSKYIEELTTSGKLNLDPEVMKKVKKICRQSDDYVGETFRLTMAELEKEHAEIRLSAFQIADELFNRSHCFRELLLADFQNFMELTLETDPELPVPKPKSAAKEMKKQTQEAIQKWHEKFGEAYKKLDLGYNYLKSCKKVNFADINAHTLAQRRQEEERRVRLDNMERERKEKVIQDMTDTSAEIMNSLIQTENCLRLILPDPDGFHINGLMSPEYEPGNPWKLRRNSSKEDDRSSTTAKHKYSGFHSLNAESESHTNSPSGEKSPRIEIKQEHGISSDTGEIKEKQENEANETMKLEENQDKSVRVKNEPPDSQMLNNPKAGASQPVDNESEHSSEFGEITDNESDEYEEEEEDLVRDFGLGSQQYNITIQLPSDEVHLEENLDNTDLLVSIKDQCQLMENLYLPQVQKWLEALAKFGGGQGEVKKALDLKKMMKAAIDKVRKLKVLKMPKPKPSVQAKCADSEEEDSDFEEVPTKEGYEPRIPDELREEYGLVPKQPKPSTSTEWNMVKEAEKFEDDPASYMATLKKIRDRVKNEKASGNKYRTSSPRPKLHTKEIAQGLKASSSPSSRAGSSTMSSIAKDTESSSSKEEKMKIAPVLPFGMDLMHWGEEDVPLPMIVRYENDSHRFWTPISNDDNKLVDYQALAQRKSRVINFVGKFEPVKWTCRTPLANGKLCPRMDRKKCPFHGMIVPRDHMGNPANPEDIARLRKEEERKKEAAPPEWDDPELQADIKAATGMDISRKGKGRGKGKGKGKRSKNQYPHLTDLKKQATSRSRLEKKVFDKAAMKRVSGTLDELDSKRFSDKFANQFNYAYKNAVNSK